MARRVRRIALLVIALALIGGIVLVVTGRGSLDDERDRVDERWAALREPLATRYAVLSDVITRLDQVDAEDRDVTQALARELERWSELQRASGEDVETEAEVATANLLEGLYVRTFQTVERSPRLRAEPELTAALGRFAGARPDDEAVDAYNDAAEAYQATREGLRYSLTVRLFGYDTRPAFVLATEAAPDEAPDDET